MSLVLGPIHHWMYGKVKTSEGRESAIVDAFKNTYSIEADELLRQIYSKYPAPGGDKSLEELLAGKSIHQGIQSLIVAVETREAAIIAAFCNKFTDAEEVALKASHDHGVFCGQDAVKTKGLTGAECEDTAKVFEVLGDYLCDGMPCDRGAQVVEETKERTSWDHESCVHESYWKDAGADFLIMCNIVSEWVAGFGEGINSQIGCKREKAIAAGDPSCFSVYGIKK